MQRREIKQAVKSAKHSAQSSAQCDIPLSFEKTVSTGSTLLDLAISGERCKFGGIPAGIFVEIFGPPGIGKSLLLVEIMASAQARGGNILCLDPEARLDRDYAELFGTTLHGENYKRPNTVKGAFAFINDFIPEKKEIAVVALDGLAALSTEMEMEGEDKMGMKRAKDFHEVFRRSARLIAERNVIVVSSNQLREGDEGPTTSGGKAIPFYASLRIRIKPSFKGSRIEKSITFGNKNKNITQQIGTQVECIIYKSSLGTPFLSVPMSIIFKYGIDDLRDQLQWYKDITGETTYNVIEKSYQRLGDAIHFIEDKEWEEIIKERTQELWLEIQNNFSVQRTPKSRS